MRTPHYETDEDTFPAEAYKVVGYRGIAWRVYGWETEPDPSPEWYDKDTDTWYEESWDGESMRRTGRVVAVMVGDDRRFTFEPNELTPLGDLDYCASCGQIGCTHDARGRSNA